MRAYPHKGKGSRIAAIARAVMALGTLALLIGGPGVSAASFTPVGSFSPTDVSADGSVVVGTSIFGAGTGAFRWTASGGMQNLGDLPGGTFFTEARAISDDGTTIVGRSSSASGFEAFRWTQTGGMIGLGDFPSGLFFSIAEDVSGDGSVVVGQGRGTTTSYPFRWTAAGGMEAIGAFSQSGVATGVSADGLTIVGIGNTSSFRWTSGGGFEFLGNLADGRVPNSIKDVSADGSTIVGSSSGLAEAFRWTRADGTVGLGDFPEGNFMSVANGVSGDGSVVVGQGTGDGRLEAFVWTSSAGMQRLLDVLVANGATNLDGWELTEATAISSDGQWVVGRARSSTLGFQGFVANIAPVPAPAAAWLFGGALAGLIWLRRR